MIFFNFHEHSQICHVEPAVGSGVNPTCGKKCASKLQASSGLPDPNHPRISGPSRNSSLVGWPSLPSWSLLPSWSDSAPSATQTRSQSRPNQLRMCDVSTLVMTEPRRIAYRMLGMSCPPSISKRG